MSNNPISRMKELLPEGRWIQGSAVTIGQLGKFNYCLAGARDRSIALGTADDFLAQRIKINNYLHNAINTFEADSRPLRSSIVRWNDNPDRTYADIQNVLDIAEKQWEADHKE